MGIFVKQLFAAVCICSGALSSKLGEEELWHLKRKVSLHIEIVVFFFFFTYTCARVLLNNCVCQENILELITTGISVCICLVLPTHLRPLTLHDPLHQLMRLK